MEGRFEAAVGQADALIRAGRGKKDELYYLKGISQLKLNKFAEARESFDYVIARYPRSKNLFDAYLGRGDSYLLAGDAGKALGVYNEMKVKFAKDSNRALLNHRLAECYEKLGLKEKAAQQRASVKNEAPLSFEAKGSLAAVSSPSAVRQTVATGTNAQVFSVQIGSFKSRSNADKLARKMTAEGYDARIEIPLSAGDNLYRVKIGRVASRVAAEALAARLAADGHKTRICVDRECE